MRTHHPFLESSVMRLLARTTVNTLCAVTLLGLAACGTGTSSAPKADSSAKDAGPFAGMSGPEIANKAITTTKKAKSMTVAVDTTTDEGKVSAHLATSTSGNCAGTMSIGPAGTMGIRKVGDTVYTQFDEALLREQSKGEPAEDVDAAVEMLAGHWMKSAASDPDSKDMLELCDLGTLLKGFEANDNAAQRGGETTVDGKRALRLTEKDGEDTYTMLVATEGEPYILQLDAKGKDPMTMKLSEFDKPLVVEAPAVKDIVDPEKPNG
ncbi:hypothetical protein [Streptomyces sp. NPDC056061]|uniref:hypothetical protein n=1 Tax=Streptomyces sp. NPDC056061 TaxID=3345700 RepID=UPI0035DFD8A3